ncbi:RdgB/HAM1 family non-canonical purine NTP pyrophosphatase [Shewanella amazonensis]
MMKKVVLASGNKGKLKEFNEMFSEYSLSVVAQSEFQVPDVEETGTTFVENAIIKARHAAAITGLPAIADDSGLEVDALEGAPGIYSARYAGVGAKDTDNWQKLLGALEGKTERSARFQCVLVYMRHAKDPTPIICQAAWEGRIGLEARGDNGHGYDPVFIAEGGELTAAQMSSDAKNAVSHRGKALEALLAEFRNKGII